MVPLWGVPLGRWHLMWYGYLMSVLSTYSPIGGFLDLGWWRLRGSLFAKQLPGGQVELQPIQGRPLSRFLVALHPPPSPLLLEVGCSQLRGSKLGGHRIAHPLNSHRDRHGTPPPPDVVGPI